VLRHGGKLVEYGYPGFRGMLLGYGNVLLLDALPNGRSAESYGITALYLKDKEPFLEDLPVLFGLLESGKLKPVIADRLPILEAARANLQLERGGVRGKIVLLAPELG
jgi:NADPH:quinone reductase-like Zn-dependent oxidoreductase